MSQLNQTFTQNFLLGNLAPPDLTALQPHLEWVDLELQQVLSKPDQSLEHAYFVAEGICSIIAVNPGGVRIEAGLIGREGFVGAPLVLSVDTSPYEVMVQADGRALRVTRDALLETIKKSPGLNTLLLRFVHTFTLQTAHTALANGRCTIEQRLARWLLMCHDRVDTNEFVMTHEFLSVMLAVRRSSITDALHGLEGKKTIQSMRGRIRILNRARLEQAAGAAYGVPESEYERLISPLRKRPTDKKKS
jgi:CRP-like cAMP-binding protein